MSQYDETTYGRLWADGYDEFAAEADQEMIDFLAGYAGEPPRALELAIGTGRVALPLSAKGVEVSGIDISEEMVAKLRDKPGGSSLQVTIGDMRDVGVDGTFPLVYLVFNTIFGLLTQKRQVECFQNVADHLEPGGRFVIDCFVPDMKRFNEQNTRLEVGSIVSNEEHTYEMSIHHPVEQRIDVHVVKRRADGSEVLLPIGLRYAWPSELDLMAKLAGLELEERWGWYDLRPFTERSASHVSVYRKPL